jgi:hypothetical protein
MISLTKEFFDKGIEELKLFFQKFRPSADQVEVWYSRLNNFTSDEYQLAIFRITESGEYPSYVKLKEELWKAKHDLAEIKIKIGGQGWAPRSPEHIKLAKMLCSALAKITGERMQRKITKELADQSFAQLTEIWNAEYKNLPDYKSESEIEHLIQARQWKTLIEIGFLESEPEVKAKPYVRSFYRNY